MGKISPKWLDLLDHCVLTQGWDLSHKETFAQQLTLLSVKAKDVVFWEGAVGSNMFFVLSGSIVVSKKIRGKVEKVLAHFKEGDFFGELALVDESPRSATVQAEKQATLLVLEKDNPSGLAENADQMRIPVRFR